MTDVTPDLIAQIATRLFNEPSQAVAEPVNTNSISSAESYGYGTYIPELPQIPTAAPASVPQPESFHAFEVPGAFNTIPISRTNLDSVPMVQEFHFCSNY